MKALIIGGGIGGLTAGIALEQAGIETEIFETSPELRVAGAGIWMATNAMQVFDRLGLAQAILGRGTALERVSVADHRLRVIQNSEQAPFKERYGFAITSLLRARLSEALAGAYPGVIHFDKAFQRLTQEAGRVVAHFADGSNAEGDLLIGADGIHSVVRDHVAPGATLRYSGQTCWRGIADIALDTPYAKACVEAWGPACRLGFSVVSEREVYWFLVAKAPLGEQDEPQGLKEKLAAMVAGFAPPIPSIVEATPETRVVRNDISDLRRLPIWYAGRVCLIGDAAHATTPNMGQGGGQAVEDAWNLARILQTERDPERAFAAFERKRRKKVDQVVNASWMIGRTAHLSTGRRLRNFLLRNMPAGPAERMMMRLYEID